MSNTATSMSVHVVPCIIPRYWKGVVAIGSGRGSLRKRYPVHFLSNLHTSMRRSFAHDLQQLHTWPVVAAVSCYPSIQSCMSSRSTDLNGSSSLSHRVSTLDTFLHIIHNNGTTSAIHEDTASIYINCDPANAWWLNAHVSETRECLLVEGVQVGQGLSGRMSVSVELGLFCSTLRALDIGLAQTWVCGQDAVQPFAVTC